MKTITAFICLIILSVITPAQAGEGGILSQQPYDRVLGDPDAPVTIVEYSSLSCPHCADFHTEVLPKLKEEYIETGKVRMLARNFPLNASALHGAMLTMCVPEDKYHTFLKVLFRTQSKWAMSMDYRDNLQSIARVGGVSPDAFEDCLNDKALEEKVLEIRREATEALTIEATPTFYINGEKVQGAKSYDAFASVIDEQLAQMNKKAAKSQPMAQ